MKLCATDFVKMKPKRKIAMLTAYTAPVARCLEKAGIPILLVGDSLGMVEMGFASTQSVTLEHMKYHTGAVRRGAPNTHIIADMPYLTDTDEATALQSAEELIQAGADSVKLEGPKYAIIRHLVTKGISVVGHTGLTPQTATCFAQVGREEHDAARIVTEATGIAEAGAFMLVLEHIPSALGKRVTAAVSIPTIGIGAGDSCDGQVMVINDAIGLGEKWPPFSRQYAQVSETILEIAARYQRELYSEG